MGDLATVSSDSKVIKKKKIVTRLNTGKKKKAFDIRDCNSVLTLFTNTRRRFEAAFLAWFYPTEKEYQTAVTLSFEDFQKLYF